MKLSHRAEYALLALIHLAENYRNELCKISDIAMEKHIPRKFLEQILIVLNRAGYVRSRKGSRGGYMLAKPPNEITLAEVIRLIDGALAPVESASTYFYEPTPLEQNKPVMQIFKEIRNYIADRLEHTSLAELIEG